MTLNLLRTSQVVQCLVTKDYHLLSLNLTIDLCVVQRFNTPRTYPWAPSSNPHSPAPMQFISVVKPKVEPNPTLKLATQAAKGATHNGLNLGPN
jgi:hypothetical protein